MIIMQRKDDSKDKSEISFSIIEDENFNFDEAIPVRNAQDVPSPTSEDEEQSFNFSRKGVRKEPINTDSDEEQPEVFVKNDRREQPKLARQTSSSLRPPSAGPSSSGYRSSARPQSPNSLNITKSQNIQQDSDSDDSNDETKTGRVPVPGEYDPTAYESLIVNDEIKELFQYIRKYTPQYLQLDFKFKPFIPEFLPAVGDIDAFLKVVPPDVGLSGKHFNANKLQLGIAVLDEPAANQSDPALLHLQLRASSVNVTSNRNMVVKKVTNVEKNTKIIDKWIKDITDLRKTKSSPVVKYSELMPDLDELMQEWPENMENLLKLHGFPSYKFNGSLSQYIDIICCLFDIPIYKNKIQSLHLLFCLYAAIRNSQLYQANNNEDKGPDDASEIIHNTADQLVLE